MRLNETTSGERIHIGFFGRRNAGKSSLVNRVTGQALSVVSDVKGTTTDPVRKAMELLPLGPVVIIDTPGFDDEGELGTLRVEKTREILTKTDIAVLVVDGTIGLADCETALLAILREKNLPYIVVYNKADLLSAVPSAEKNEIYVSAAVGTGIEELKNMLGALAKTKENGKRVVADLLLPGKPVVLVTPIDTSAPKGRLILPQQQSIRDILDSHGNLLLCQPEELPATLALLKEPPQLVITDSQAFGRVAKDTPPEIPMTSFSILFARYKGDLATLVRGAAALTHLKPGDKVLISEGCSHHRQCGDIGTVKLPGWIEKHIGGKPDYSFTSGGEFPTDLTGYKVVVHCGGCMLNETEMKDRMRRAAEAGVPMVNYGVAIAALHGILRRSLEIFPDMLALLDEE